MTDEQDKVTETLIATWLPVDLAVTQVGDRMWGWLPPTLHDLIKCAWGPEGGTMKGHHRCCKCYCEFSYTTGRIPKLAFTVAFDAEVSRLMGGMICDNCCIEMNYDIDQEAGGAKAKVVMQEVILAVLNTDVGTVNEVRNISVEDFFNAQNKDKLN